MQRKTASVVFADVQGYSKLTENQYMRFMSNVMKDVSDTLSEKRPFYVNSWGDAIVAAFDDPRQAAYCALDLRDLFRNRDWERGEIPALRLRVAVHAGSLYVGTDPITGREGVTGAQMTLAARLEPVTLPGHVWVTDTFVHLLEREQGLNLAWDDLGERPLAKDWGAARLYRLRRPDEMAELPSFQEEEVESEAITPLSICLRMLEIGTREQIMSSLDLLGKFEDQEAIDALIGAARNASMPDSARRMAILSLGEIRSPRVVMDMIEIAQNPAEPDNIRRPAAATLGSIKDPRAVDPLVRLLLRPKEVDASTQLRKSAVMALAKFDTLEAQQAIDSALHFEDPGIVGAAIAAAAYTKDTRFVPSLMEVGRDREQWNEHMRAAAMEALLFLGPTNTVSDHLREMAENTSEDQHLREVATLGLGLVDSMPARQTLTKIASRINDPLSVMALQALIDAQGLRERSGKKLDEIIDK